MVNSSIYKLGILFIVFIITLLTYNKIVSNLKQTKSTERNLEIHKYLFSDNDNDNYLLKSDKPIMWIHVPYEYNSRNWESFGSRSSYDLNQPYLYLTVKSIIKHCENSFQICIIDDNAFKTLLPSWSIDMKLISPPISDNVRTLGMLQLLYKYGGIVCPISFLCMRDLLPLTKHNVFVCEQIPNRLQTLTLFGANKGCQAIYKLYDHMQHMTSTDFTAESVFTNDVYKFIKRNKSITIINGSEIGIKTQDGTPIILDNLMANHAIPFNPNMYGILIPSNELMNRVGYGWYIRLSEQQVLECNNIISNYLLINNGTGTANNSINILEPYTAANEEIKNKYVGFWKTPLMDGLWGLKPHNLGDNIIKQAYEGK